MTRSLCDEVTERVALGESLGDLAEHAATCESCLPILAVSAKLGATRHAVDPGLGFSARMTIGAQHRLVVRRRRRLATGFAVSVATGALGVFLVTHTPAMQPIVTAPTSGHEQRPPSDDNSPTPDVATGGEADLAALAVGADADVAPRLSARWSHVKKPLAAYKKLLKAVTP
jgi:hypothetical protein